MAFDKTAQNERRCIRFPAQVANVTLHIEAAASVVDESRDGIGLARVHAERGFGAGRETAN
jgi:hypothetical protein